MLFYFGIFVLLAFFAGLEYFGLKQSQRTALFVVFSFMMFSLSFLRWDVGTDWGTYHTLFERSSAWTGRSDYEWGFTLLNRFAKIVFNSYTTLLFLLGSVLFWFQGRAVWRLSPFPLLSLLYLWATVFGNIAFVRQDIATMIVLFSTVFVVRRRFWPFVVSIFLAGAFHRSAFVFLPAWWLYKASIPGWVMWFGIILSLGMSVVTRGIMERLSMMFGPIVQMKIDAYTGGGDQTFGAASSMVEIMVRGFANKIVIFIALLSLWVRDEKYRGLVNLYWAGILLYFCTVGISAALARIVRPYDIVAVVLLPMMLGYVKSEGWSKVIAFGLFFVYLSMRLYVSLTGGYPEAFIPYRTIFG